METVMVECRGTKQNIAIIVLALGAVVIGCEGKGPANAIPVAGQATIGDGAPVNPGPLDWPWWRGPQGNGHADASAQPPLTWSESENVLWKVDLPGTGHASPVIWGDQLFITTADEDAQRQSLLCYDRESGQHLWSRLIHEGRFVDRHRKNTHASPTPAVDGQHVYTVFAIDDALFATAVDFDGEIIWQERLGDYDSEHGYGSSPVIHRSALIIAGDHMGGGYIAAVDRETGQLIWQTPRVRTGTSANYAAPLLAHIAGRPQLILHGYDHVASHDPDTGALLWRCDGPTHVCANTPVAGEELVYASGGFPQRRLLAIRADGSGDVTGTHLEWMDNQGVAYVPSPLLHDGRLYVVNDGGIASCYDAADGREIWRQRLDGTFSSSPVLGGGRIYISSERGVTFVIEPGDAGRILARNELSGGQFATPVFSGHRLYIRTDAALYCIGE